VPAEKPTSAGGQASAEKATKDRPRKPEGSPEGDAQAPATPIKSPGSIAVGKSQRGRAAVGGGGAGGCGRAKPAAGAAPVRSRSRRQACAPRRPARRPRRPLPIPTGALPSWPGKMPRKKPARGPPAPIKITRAQRTAHHDLDRSGGAGSARELIAQSQSASGRLHDLQAELRRRLLGGVDPPRPVREEGDEGEGSYYYVLEYGLGRRRKRRPAGQEAIAEDHLGADSNTIIVQGPTPTSFGRSRT